MIRATPASRAQPAAPEVLSEAYYDRLFALEQFHGWQRGISAVTHAFLRDPLRTGKGLRVLDIGCGTGGLVSWLRARGARATGIDLAAEALAFCRQRGHRALARASSLSLPFAAESFDLVVCTDVLQHLPHPSGDTLALAEAWRVLRQGGHLYVRTNSGCGETGPVERSATYRRYTRAELWQRLAAAGFVIERCSYANAVAALPTLLARRFRSSVNHRAHTVDPGLSLRVRPRHLRWMDDALAGVLGLEARFLTGRDLPFGDSLVARARKPSVSSHIPC